jgi:hypothetical protein
VSRVETHIDTEEEEEEEKKRWSVKREEFQLSSLLCGWEENKSRHDTHDGSGGRGEVNNIVYCT